LFDFDERDAGSVGADGSLDGAARNDAARDGSVVDSDVNLPPSCTNGALDPDESDIDCGGSSLCRRCSACRLCAVDSDCSVFSCASAGCTAFSTCFYGLCALGIDVYLDGHSDCAIPTTAASLPTTVATELPAGSYIVTAEQSGFSATSQINPTMNMGYEYHIHCENLTPTLGTTGYYATANEAFASMVTIGEVDPFPGGALVCGWLDSSCGDNLGGIRFKFEFICGGP
jgi:hypothetical protein